MLAVIIGLQCGGRIKCSKFGNNWFRFQVFARRSGSEIHSVLELELESLKSRMLYVAPFFYSDRRRRG